VTDPESALRYGFIAEEVVKVYSELVVVIDIISQQVPIAYRWPTAVAEATASNQFVLDLVQHTDRPALISTACRRLWLQLTTITTEIERYVNAIGAGTMSPTLQVKFETAAMAKARLEAKLGQTPAASRGVIEMVPALVE
jgi:hypothetical protein